MSSPQVSRMFPQMSAIDVFVRFYKLQRIPSSNVRMPRVELETVPPVGFHPFCTRPSCCTGSRSPKSTTKVTYVTFMA